MSIYDDEPVVPVPVHVSRVQKILNICRSRTPEKRNNSQRLQEDFTPLPQNDDVLFTLDRIGDNTPLAETCSSTSYSFICPGHIDAMLVIVRRLKLERQSVLKDYKFTDPDAYIRTSDDHRLSVDKTRKNDYDQFLNRFVHE